MLADQTQMAMPIPITTLVMETAVAADINKINQEEETNGIF